MTDLLLGIVAVIYLGVAFTYFREGNTGMGIAFAAYAVSNVGFYIAGMK